MKCNTYNGLPLKVDLIEFLKDKVNLTLTQLWKRSTDELIEMKESLDVENKDNKVRNWRK